MAKTPHWTYRRTEYRETLLADLRRLYDELRPGQGERIHGQLTDAQIFDWALEDKRGNLLDERVKRLLR